MRINNIGYAAALQILHSGEIKYIKTTGGQYKIPIYDNDSISKETYEKLLKENERLKTIIKSIYNIIKEETNGETWKW